MISKSKRKLVYDKYNGRCAYCGCELKLSEMQVDDIVPKFRNNEMWHQNEIGSDEISNLNPSCRMCNYYKGMGSIENFRENLKDALKGLSCIVLFMGKYDLKELLVLMYAHGF